MRFRKTCIFVLFLLLLPIAFAKTVIYAKEPIAKINVIPVESSGGAFILDFAIKNNIKRKNWGIGFFMFHVFLKYNIHIQICEDNTNKCEMLKVNKKSQNTPLSIGHITLLSPIKPFVMYPQKSYTIRVVGLLNQPKNITAMPQQPFFYDFHNKKVAYIKVVEYGDTRAYQTHLNQISAESSILTNWNMSKKTNLTSFVVPTPVHVTYESGVNNGNKITLVFYCGLSGNSEAQSYYCDMIKNQQEGYVLKIESNDILVYINTVAGVFYSQQTLLQLNYYYDNIPNETIIDYPRFKDRGVMLDTVRHFFKINEIKQLIDVMAASKLNTLHLHLADDEGFRVQLAKYNNLTQIGGVRSLYSKVPPSNLVDDEFDITNIRHKKYEKIDSIYSGYYTINQLKNLIYYANQRQITIIPEIEMPGHALAMKLSMPNIFVDFTDKSKYLSVQGYDNNVLPVCKYGLDNNFTAGINGVITAIADIFTNQTTVYALNNEISLSGDEVPIGAYADSSFCKNVGLAQLSTEEISHKYFYDVSNNLENYKISGWQQLVQQDNGVISESNVVTPNNVGHIWQWEPTMNQPVSGYVMAYNLLDKNYPVVLDFADLTYFDIRYRDKFIEPGLYWATNYAGTFEALSVGWKIDNVIVNLPKAKLKNLQGVEGALWSELIPTKEHLFYMIFPKMLGLAEAGWTTRNALNWRSLAIKLGCEDNGFLAYLNQIYEVNYRGYPKGISMELPNNVCNNTP